LEEEEEEEEEEEGRRRKKQKNKKTGQLKVYVFLLFLGLNTSTRNCQFLFRVISSSLSTTYIT
jgi:hypothetical protein